MRIEQPQRSGEPWLVFAQPGEFYGNTDDVLLGQVTPSGALQVTPRRFRGERLASARLRLDDARRTLVSGGHIRDRALERAIGVEASSGSFIVELDSGEERRFHALSPATATPGHRTTAPLYDRPSAREWAEEALQSGRATHADLFRHGSSEDPRRADIFHPHVLPPRDGHGPLVVGEHEQLPLDSWTMRRPPFLRRERTREVQRAYEAKKYAMDLVIDRHMRGFYDEGYRLWSRRGSPAAGAPPPLPTPAEIAGAWEVAEDAFLEAGLPLQVKFAHKNAQYWGDAARSDAAARRGWKP